MIQPEQLKSFVWADHVVRRKKSLPLFWWQPSTVIHWSLKQPNKVPPLIPLISKEKKSESAERCIYVTLPLNVSPHQKKYKCFYSHFEVSSSHFLFQVVFFPSSLKHFHTLKDFVAFDPGLSPFLTLHHRDF